MGSLQEQGITYFFYGKGMKVAVSCECGNETSGS